MDYTARQREDADKVTPVLLDARLSRPLPAPSPQPPPQEQASPFKFSGGLPPEAESSTDPVGAQRAKPASNTLRQRGGDIVSKFDVDGDGVISGAEMLLVGESMQQSQNRIKTQVRLIAVVCIALLLSTAANFGLVTHAVEEGKTVETTTNNYLTAKGSNTPLRTDRTLDTAPITSQLTDENFRELTRFTVTCGACCRSNPPSRPSPPTAAARMAPSPSMSQRRPGTTRRIRCTALSWCCLQRPRWARSSSMAQQ